MVATLVALLDQSVAIEDSVQTTLSAVLRVDPIEGIDAGERVRLVATFPCVMDGVTEDSFRVGLGPVALLKPTFVLEHSTRTVASLEVDTSRASSDEVISLGMSIFNLLDRCTGAAPPLIEPVVFKLSKSSLHTVRGGTIGSNDS